MQYALGKIILAVIVGMLTRNPIYMIVAAVVGHFLDVIYWRVIEPKRQTMQFKQGVSEAFVRLCAKLMRQDGFITRRELQLFKQVTDYNNQEEKVIQAIFDQAKLAPYAYGAAATDLYNLLKHRPLDLSNILEILFALSASDGKIEEAELNCLRRVHQIFQLPLADFDVYYHRYAGGEAVEREKASREEDANFDQANKYVGDGDLKFRDILGVSLTANEAEVRKAYRALVRELHPDKLSATGASDKDIKAAEVRLAEINIAYQALKSSF